MFLKYVFFLSYDCENDFEDKLKEKNPFACSNERRTPIYMFCICLSLRLFFSFLSITDVLCVRVWNEWEEIAKVSRGSVVGQQPKITLYVELSPWHAPITTSTFLLIEKSHSLRCKNSNMHRFKLVYIYIL